MKFPLISEYVETVKNAEDNFATLTNLRPIKGEDGNPVMTSGNFAVVFKMRDEKSGKYYAVKCFLKDQPNRAENYRMIADELEYVSSNFLTKFQYLDNELFVDSVNADGDEFPVLLMDWVEGVNLDQYIYQHIDDSYQLHMLAYQFSRLAMWLMPQPFAHGDLKPDNIMVREDGTLVLIDYDGMFVPAMEGQKAREMGSPDFRHPARTEDTFNEHIDDFSLVSILLSLRTIAEEPSLLEKYGAADRLLFSEKDYHDIHSCQLLKDIFPSECAEVNNLVALFIIALTQTDLSNVSFRLMSLERPKEQKVEFISAKITEEDKKNAWTDEYGVKYSKDGKKLLKCTNKSLMNYFIRQETKCIGDSAFEWCTSLQSVIIPNSVTSIGDNAFSWCSSLHSISIPDSVTSIGDSAFSWCSSLQSISIPDSVTSIGDSAFLGCLSLQSVTLSDSVTSIGDSVFLRCQSLQSVNIPDSVISIGNSAFGWCLSLQSVIIPGSVTSIGSNPFFRCSAKVTNHSKNFIIFEGNLFTSDKQKLISFLSNNKSNFIIPNSVNSIGDRAFNGCKFLQSVTIPHSVTSIGNYAFDGCSSLQAVTIPNSVTSIGNNAFYGCSSLQAVTIPNSVTSIGNNAFYGCSSLHSVTIPNSVTSIGDSTFFYCSSLQSVAIPDSVTIIGDSAFEECKSLQSVIIPDSMTSIGSNPFSSCSAKITNYSKHFIIFEDNLFTSDKRVLISFLSKVSNYIIPDSVTDIGNSAFLGCSSLQSVTIPDSVTSIGDSAFCSCESLQSLTVPNSLTKIGDWAFDDCESLQSIFISHQAYGRLKDNLLYYSSIIKFTD